MEVFKLSSDATDLASVDLTDAGLFADGPPHELFARMRTIAGYRDSHPSLNSANLSTAAASVGAV